MVKTVKIKKETQKQKEINMAVQSERLRLIKRFSFFNVLLIFVLFISLSTVNVNFEETRKLIDTTKKQEFLQKELDSLKNNIVVRLDSLKYVENELIKKTLGLSFNNPDYEYVNIDDYRSAIDRQGNNFRKINTHINFSYDSISRIPTSTPVSSTDFIRISSKFGWRKHPILKRWIFHEGVDISAIKKTNVYATADGIVENVYYSEIEYGNRVVINHGYGYKTVYAHLSKINVKKGQKLKRYDLIGYVGSTGRATNNHLHYEILVNNKPVDPLKFIYSYGELKIIKKRS